MNSLITASDLTSAAALHELTSDPMSTCEHHQVTLVPASGATGTVPVWYRPRGAAASHKVELLDPDDSPIEIDLSDPTPIRFAGFVTAVIVDMTGVTGTVTAIVESR